MTNKIKIIKKTAITAGVIVLIYLLLLLIAGIYINKKKDSILTSIRTELKNKLNGNATIGDLEITVWRHFPYIGFELTDFSITDSVYNKPLLSAKKLAATFNIFYLLTKKNEVKNITIENGAFHMFTDSAGYTNKYLLEPKRNDTASQKKNSGNAVKIDGLQIKETSVLVDGPGKEISFIVNDLDASLDNGSDIIQIEMNEKISMKRGLGFNLSRGAYLENHLLEGSWKMQLDKATQTLSFGKVLININRYPFELSGSFSFKDERAFSVIINTKDIPFQNAIQIVTQNIRDKISLVQLKGPVTLDAVIKGSLLPNRSPFVNVNIRSAGSNLNTPVASFTACNFEGNFTNSINKDSAYGDPNSQIAFKAFSGNWDGIILTGKNISITNLENPQLKCDFYSNCTFEALDDKFALKDISFVNGTADLHLFYRGALPTEYSMLQDLEGELNVKNGTVLYVPRNFTFTNCNGELAFYRDSVSIKNFTCNYLKNKLEVEAEGRNIQHHLITGDVSQEAMVKCSVHSEYINLDDFKPLFAVKKQRIKIKKPAESFKAVTGRLDDLLANSIINVEVKTTEVKREKLLAKNFEADIKFYPKRWELARVSVDFAGGSIVTTGLVQNNADDNHDALLTVKINNVDVKKLLYAFDDFEQDAITQKHLQGIFSTDASLKAVINSVGKIVPASLYGTVDFSLKNGALQNYPPLMNLKTFVFKDRDMTDVRFAELKDRLEIKGTEVYINRMEIQSSVFRLFLEGNYGFDGKNTELLMQVPLSNLRDKNFTDNKAPENKGTKAKVGLSIWLRAESDKDGKVKIKPTLRAKLKNKKA